MSLLALPYLACSLTRWNAATESLKAPLHTLPNPEGSTTNRSVAAEFLLDSNLPLLALPNLENSLTKRSAAAEPLLDLPAYL